MPPSSASQTVPAPLSLSPSSITAKATASMPAFNGGKTKKVSSTNLYYLFNGTRYAILLLCTACLTLVIADSLALNFTVICMDAIDVNGTVVPMFSPIEQGWLFSAISIGQLIGTLPITMIINCLGPRKMFTMYGLVCAFATLAIPPSVYLAGFPGILVMRIIQGFGMACVWVTIGAVSAEWVPPSSSSIFIAFLSCNLQFGPIISMPLAAQLCSASEWSWRWVYYFLGLFSVLFFAVFYAFFRDSPQLQKHVSVKELALFGGPRKISSLPSSKDTTSIATRKAAKVPYRSILSDYVFWGLFVSMATGNLAFQIFWQYGPVYLNKVLGIEVANTGIAAALPFLLSAIFKIVAGELSDHVNLISVKAKVILFASVSQYLMAICFLALAILPKFGVVNVALMQSCFTAATVFSGLNAVGIVRSAQLVSRQFSHVLFSWNTLMMSIIMLLLPLIVSWLTPHNSVDEWAHVYFLITACVFAGTTFFNFTAEVEPRPWAVGESQCSSSKSSVQSTAAAAATIEEGQSKVQKGVVVFTIDAGSGSGQRTAE